MLNFKANGLRAIGRALILLLLLLPGLGACSSHPDGLPPSPSPLGNPAISTDLATLGREQVLYSENFDNSSDLPGWEVKSDNANAHAVVKGGAYHLTVESGGMVTILRDHNFTDSTLTVDLEFLGPDPAKASIGCRNLEGGYSFSITNTGHWQIDRSDAKLPARGDTQALLAGVNQIAVACIGKQLSFSLNGEELGSVQDDAFPEGQIALGLESSGKAEVVFDNLTISRPASGDEIASISTSNAEPTFTATFAPTVTPTQIPVSTPTLRPTLIPAGKLTLYQTEFEAGDPSLADWRTFAYSFADVGLVTTGYEASPVNGTYHFRATDPEQGTNLRVFSIYDQDLGAADVDISMQGAVPTSQGSLGLVCRYTAAGWYQFMLEPHDVWSIRLVKTDENGQFHFHTISSGRKYHGLKAELRAECKGDRLIFYIDGEKMASLHDSTFPVGKVGLLGWSFPLSNEDGMGMPSGDIGMVDNFAVQRAQWNETSLPAPAPTPGADGLIYSTDFARLADLNPYWMIQDAGVWGIPGSPVLVGGPDQPSPHTYLYINDFDPGPDVEISADIHGELNFMRGLICRYSEDGWYEAFSMKDSAKFARIALVRKERDEQGKSSFTLLGTYYTSPGKTNLTLTCVGNVLSVKLNGEQVLSADDDTWQSGRYGFFFVDNPPGNLHNSLLSYSVHPQQAVQVGGVISDATFTTPEEIAAVFQVSLDDPRVQISENTLKLAPDNNPLHLFTNKKYEDGEFRLDVEIQAESSLNLHCRAGSAADIGATLRGNGDWGIDLQFKQILAGNSAAIQPGKNQFVLACINDQVSLSANGETLATVTLPNYQPVSGTNGFDVFEYSAPIFIRQADLKTLKSSTVSPAPALLNQVNIPNYQPGETIFAWDMEALFYRPGWWGKEDRPWNWTNWYSGANPPEREDQRILIPSNQGTTVFTYRPDLYDLPIAISAETTLTSKGGGAGLFCRFTEGGRYEFLVQPDGKWTIRRNTSVWYAPRAVNITILAHGVVDNFQPQNAQISAVCKGSELIFSLNGAEMGRAQDTFYPEGQAGIFFDANTTASFTNLTVQRTK